MPTYEYVCKGCGERLEVYQSFSARPLRKHEACGGELQKVFHPRGVVFKGSGFYVTDSRKSTSSSGSDSSKKEPSKESSKDSAKESASTSSTTGSSTKATSDAAAD